MQPSGLCVAVEFSAFSRLYSSHDAPTARVALSMLAAPRDSRHAASPRRRRFPAAREACARWRRAQPAGAFPGMRADKRHARLIINSAILSSLSFCCFAGRKYRASFSAARAFKPCRPASAPTPGQQQPICFGRRFEHIRPGGVSFGAFASITRLFISR